MANKTREELKQIFVTKAKPTENNFHDWLDAYVHSSEKLDYMGEASTNTIPSSIDNNIWYFAKESGVYQYFNDSTGNPISVNIDSKLVRLIHTTGANYWSKEETNVTVEQITAEAFTQFLQNEIDRQDPPPIEHTYGTDVINGNAPGGDDPNAINDIFLFTNPIHSVTSDGIITEISIPITRTGNLCFSIGTYDGSHFILRKRLDPINITNIGVNVLQVSETIHSGEVLAIDGARATPHAGILFGALSGCTLIQAYPPGSAAHAEIVGSGYLYSFKTQTTAPNSHPLKVYVKKDELTATIQPNVAALLQNEIDRQDPVSIYNYGTTSTTGNPPGGDDPNFTGPSVNFTTPIHTVSYTGVITEISIPISRAGYISFAIGTFDGAYFTVRKRIPSILITTLGVNILSVNEIINTGETLVLDNSRGIPRAGVLYGSVPGSTLIQAYPPGGTAHAQIINSGYLYSFKLAVTQETEHPLQENFAEIAKLPDTLSLIASTKQEMPATTIGINTDFNSNLGIVSTQGYYGNSQASSIDGYINSITINTETAGTVMFALGLIDQHNIFIEQSTFSATVGQGINVLSLSEPIAANQYLFLKTPDTTSNLRVNSTLTGGRYLYSITGYNAPLTSVNNANIAYIYSVVEVKQPPIIGRKEFEDFKASVSPSNFVIVRSPNGTPFRLTVDDNGNVGAIPNVFTKMLVLGNSITRHGLMSYWWGDWGMAASERSKDFVHVLETMFKSKNPAFTAHAENIAVWEGNPTAYDKTTFDSYFAFNPDLVVIRVGENVADTTNFQTAFENLIDYIIGKVPNATIVVGGMFWPNADKDTMMSAAAANRGCLFVPMSHLDTTENISYIGAIVMGDDGQQHAVDNGGVANHPGDLGMQRIAETLYNAIN